MTIFLLIVAVVLLIAWIISKGDLKKQQKLTVQIYQELQSAKEELARKEAESNQFSAYAEKEINDLRYVVSKLEKYKAILDVELEVLRIKEKAELEAKILILEATSELKQAKAEVKEIRDKASEKTQNQIQAAESKLKLATLDASKIIEIANKRAEEIAGDAYRALKDSERLEKVAQAMKNVIEGYGDQYLKPGYNLLDELANEFSHLEAGRELLAARERTRLMVVNGTAANCEYVESYRRITAINFILDAFNGKVDSILSLVKSNNYGVLEQKIKDAFYLVNNLGKAFRNVSITEEFMLARLQELYWATITQELKLQEKEEQRLIKEQIREEEKARREYEKAIKEAAKEEDMLKRAIEKAQREVALASEEQKANYEARLIELTGKLQAAEEKNQRALSMAQQTRTGHVYIISNIGSFGEHVYKIGMTRRLEPIDRIKELGDASVPFEFDVHSLILSDDAPGLEKQLHKKFLQMQLNKVNPRKEFFQVSLKEIREEIEKMGINAKWTMAAEAREYRESLAVDIAIQSNPLTKERWLHQQLEAADKLEVEEEVVAEG